MYTNILVPVVLDPEHPPTAALEVAEAISHALEQYPENYHQYELQQLESQIRARLQATSDSP